MHLLGALCILEHHICEESVCGHIGYKRHMIWTYGGTLALRLKHHHDNLSVTGELPSAIHVDFRV